MNIFCFKGVSNIGRFIRSSHVQRLNARGAHKRGRANARFVNRLDRPFMGCKVSAEWG